MRAQGREPRVSTAFPAEVMPELSLERCVGYLGGNARGKDVQGATVCKSFGQAGAGSVAEWWAMRWAAEEALDWNQLCKIC